MPVLTSPPLTATDAAVVQQAAAVVAEAVRGALGGALRAAEVCGCRTCRAQAVRTFTWAVTLHAAEPVTGEP